MCVYASKLHRESRTARFLLAYDLFVISVTFFVRVVLVCVLACAYLVILRIFVDFIPFWTMAGNMVGLAKN